MQQQNHKLSFEQTKWYTNISETRQYNENNVITKLLSRFKNMNLFTYAESVRDFKVRAWCILRYCCVLYLQTLFPWERNFTLIA